MCEPESALLPSDTTSSAADTTSCPSPSRQRRHPGGLFYAIITVSLTGNILLVVVVTAQTLRTSRDSLKNSAGGFSHSLSHVDTAEVCFTCDQLGPLIESKDTLYGVIRLSSGHTFCCQRQNNGITKVFKKIVSDEYLRRLTGREPSDRGCEDTGWISTEDQQGLTFIWFLKKIHRHHGQDAISTTHRFAQTLCVIMEILSSQQLVPIWCTPISRSTHHQPLRTPSCTSYNDGTGTCQAWGRNPCCSVKHRSHGQQLRSKHLFCPPL
ncbi:uncharacterized protein LOC124268958 [Haliotis rubra]|uniref:uncharacterized protein LOC124268958 n=1 Tax=Haliotis rubra TaxID=36100 RepID=UPI001EE5A58F|nr:uncharacterized protein LOC124268958 [Haliotis rubra]